MTRHPQHPMYGFTSKDVGCFVARAAAGEVVPS